MLSFLSVLAELFVTDDNVSANVSLHWICHSVT